MSDYTPTSKPVTGAWNTTKVLRDEYALVATAVNSKADRFGTSSVSTTSLTIDDILQTFTMETGKEFIPGMTVYMGDSTAPATNYMLGMLVSYNSVTGLSSALVTSHVGSGTMASWVIGLSNSTGATLVNNAFAGHQDFARATVASAATTSAIWAALGNQIDFTGTATVTGFPAALQAGAERTLICAAACTFTASTNMLIDGIASGSSVTCAANDKMIVRAITTTQFNLTRIRYDGLAQKLVGRNEVLLHSPNNYGSINTYIRRFTTALVNTGSALTYADSATLGASITVNEAGIYRVSCSDNVGAGTLIGYGVSKNSTQLTTGIFTITAADRMCAGTVLGANAINQVSTDIYCVAGDVLRHHGAQTTANDTSALSIFGVLKLSDA